MGLGIVRENTDDMNVFGVAKLGAGGIDKFATEYKVKALCHHMLLGSDSGATLSEPPGGAKKICLKSAMLGICRESGLRLVHVANWRIHSLMDAMPTPPGNLAAVLS
ncbi:hypothetical protein GCM10017635_28960 [Paracoccus kondratievae]|uniref:Uncharacterized protein n=1 Tax=Paracoccus kondratievae TaxID=135740 RepID=A0AAD3P175_9RHOB|nr:hypothetical protein GCM10017635_28960 [Paracoccus kondratievae]